MASSQYPDFSPLPSLLNESEHFHWNQLAFHTNSQPGAHIVVDLGKPMTITRIYIQNRTVQSLEAAKNLTVWFSITSKLRGEMVWTALEVLPEWNFVLKKPTSARYVTIGLPENISNYFHLRKVKIFGYEAGLEKDRVEKRVAASAKKVGVENSVAETPQYTQGRQTVLQNKFRVVVGDAQTFNEKSGQRFPSSRNKAKDGKAEASSQLSNTLPQRVLLGARTGDSWSLAGPQGIFIATWAKPVLGRYILIFGRTTPKENDRWGAATISVNGGKATPILGMSGSMVALIDLGHRAPIQKIEININGSSQFPGMAGLEIHE